MGWIDSALIFLLPIVGALALFAFLSVAVWAGSRRREREAYYQYEFRKRLVDAGKLDAEDVKSLVEFEQVSSMARSKYGLRVGGVVLTGVGLGLLFGLRFIDGDPVWMVGYIPLFLGLTMLVAGYVMARGVPDEPRVARRPSAGPTD